MLLTAGGSRAGDVIEGYFWVIGAEKAPAAKTLSNYEYVTEVQRIAKKYEAECGGYVNVWHSDLVHGFASGLWVIYTVFEFEKAEALAHVGKDPCSKKGYLKKSTISLPGYIAACSSALDECKKDGVGPGKLTLASAFPPALDMPFLGTWADTALGGCPKANLDISPWGFGEEPIDNVEVKGKREAEYIVTTIVNGQKNRRELSLNDGFLYIKGLIDGPYGANKSINGADIYPPEFRYMRCKEW